MELIKLKKVDLFYVIKVIVIGMILILSLYFIILYYTILIIIIIVSYRVVARTQSTPDSATYNLGFRCVKELK